MFLHVWSCFVRYVYFYHKSSYFFPFSFLFWHFLFLFQFQILISRVTRQVDMADQIPSGTGQRENSDQIPDVSATQRNLCHQATTEFVGYIHNISPLKKEVTLTVNFKVKKKLSGECVFRHQNWRDLQAWIKQTPQWKLRSSALTQNQMQKICWWVTM